MTTKTKSQLVAADISALLRARNPLLWIVSREESRVEKYLFEACAAASYELRTWDVAQGAADINGNPAPVGDKDPGDMLAAIGQQATSGSRTVWVMRDLPVWLAGPTGAATLRQLRNLCRTLPSAARENAQSIVILTPSSDIPPELSDHATVIEWPMPDRAEIASILQAALNGLPDDIRATAAPNGTGESAIDAAVGLSGDEAAACYAKSLVKTRKIDPAEIASEKKRIIAKAGVLEWIDPLPNGLDSVGGLENLKAWLVARKQAYSPAAREYGLPAPKGALLVGVPGCGKSLTAKAISTAWNVPLLRMDLGALKSKYVGESEGNLRKALNTIEAIGRCVVWLDEIEKALSGATQGAADGGVAADALGTLLTWLQDKRGGCFVIATANDVDSLPPELLRKGRFDELFFVDLPNTAERISILAATLRSYGRNGEAKLMALGGIAAASEGFTGSECAELVPSAMYTAFADNAREITTADLLDAAKGVVPLSRTAKQKIERIRAWGNERARPASRQEESTGIAAPKLRAIDI